MATQGFARVYDTPGARGFTIARVDRVPGTPHSPDRAMTTRTFGHWKGDLAGGLTAAVLTVPVSLGYGILALSPLGDAYVSHGAKAGLWCAVLLPLVGAFLRGESTLMYAPRSVVAFLIGSVAVHNLAGAGVIAVGDVRGTLATVFFVVFLAGCFQALMGTFRLGGLIRYVPFPVMAGFQNAAAVLMFFSQLPALLGIARAVRPHEVLQHLGATRPLTALVGLVTALAMWQAPRLLPRVPPAIVGLVAGSAAYYALAVLGASLGPVIGPLPSVLPTIYFGDFFGGPARLGSWGDVAVLVSASLSIAIVASLDALLCAKTVEGVTGHRPSGNRELFRLGVGNAVAASAGSLAGGINLGSSFAAFRAGGRTGLTGLVSALGVLAAILALGPLVAFIPRVVIAGMLAVVSLQLLDKWSVELARRMVAGRLAHWQRMTVDLLVVVVVAVVAVAVNLVAAVGLGLAVAIVSFLTRMSRSIVRRSYRGDVIHSRKARDPEAMAALADVGRRTLVLELDGPLFFGTAEALARQVEQALLDDVTCVVLDMKRVNEIDSTGGRILRQLGANVRSRGGRLLLSHVPVSGRLGGAFHDHGVVTAVGAERIFPDTDRALEWAEDGLLAGERGAAAEGELPLGRMHVCAGLLPEQCAVLEGLVERRVYAKGSAVMEEGDRSHEVYLIARGAASATVHVAGPDRHNRLATFSAGTVFGEMALLDEAPRSATVRADDELVCYVLSREAFGRLTRDHDAIAITLLANLARELSARLRRANRAIAQLEA